MSSLGLDDFGGNDQLPINLQDRTIIPITTTVVGGTEHCQQLLAGKELVSTGGDLVGSDDDIQTIGLTKGVDTVRSEHEDAPSTLTDGQNETTAAA